MFFSEIYGSWKEIQRQKYKQIFSVLGKDFFAALEMKLVLDLGCGIGYFESFMKENGIKAKIIGIDTEFARNDFPFVIGDGNELPFKNNVFDAVFCIDAIHLIKTKDFARVIKKKGLVLFAVFFNNENYEERKSLVKEKLAGFEILLEFEINGKEKEYVVLARKNNNGTRNERYSKDNKNVNEIN